MTRNMKFYWAKWNGNRVKFRDLTVGEIGSLNLIKNDAERYEQAALRAIVDIDPNTIDWPIRMEIGKEALLNSTNCIKDDQIFEVYVKDYRNSVKDDISLWCIDSIIKNYPGQSIIELMNLTYKDLIELVCSCEISSGKKLFNVEGGIQSPKSKGLKLINMDNLPDGGQSLRQRIRDIEKL